MANIQNDAPKGPFTVLERQIKELVYANVMISVSASNVSLSHREIWKAGKQSWE